MAGIFILAGESPLAAEEVEILRKLDGLLYSAFLESQEFGLYYVLDTLLGAYQRLFVSTEGLPVHGTLKTCLSNAKPIVQSLETNLFERSQIRTSA